MKFFLTILITLLVYNLFGTILYFKERHSRTAKQVLKLYFTWSEFTCQLFFLLNVLFLFLEK